MDDEPRIASEMEKMEYEPLLRAEKWMISVSLSLGVLLLVVFVLVSRVL